MYILLDPLPDDYLNWPPKQLECSMYAWGKNLISFLPDLSCLDYSSIIKSITIVMFLPLRKTHLLSLSPVLACTGQPVFGREGHCLVLANREESQIQTHHVARPKHLTFFLPKSRSVFPTDFVSFESLDMNHRQAFVIK